MVFEVVQLIITGGNKFNVEIVFMFLSLFIILIQNYEDPRG